MVETTKQILFIGWLKHVKPGSLQPRDGRKMKIQPFRLGWERDPLGGCSFSCDLSWLMMIGTNLLWNVRIPVWLGFCDDSAMIRHLFWAIHSFGIFENTVVSLGSLKQTPGFSPVAASSCGYRLVPTSSSPLDTLARVE